MTVPEIENCLAAMQILVDTREQPSKRAFQRYESFGVPYKSQKLEYGDYTYNFLLPNGEWFYKDSDKIHPDVMIERKMDLEEISGCLCQQRERFRAEFERAGNSAKYLLIEDGSWEKILHGRYKTKFNSNAFIGSLISWSIRYNIKIIFCQKEISGRIIREILQRELKARLERGDYG